MKLETALDPALARRLAFANEKLAEVALLARALDEGERAVAAALQKATRCRRERAADARLRDPAVAARLAAITPEMEKRTHPYAERAPVQQARLGLPPLPSTTIGSFPQTAEVRALACRLARGEMDAVQARCGNARG